ncbi:MAG: energy-coupling factor ABC transporter ATP-binding protein [Thermodesulfovibrionales bacterium]
MEVFNLENISYSYSDGKRALNGISLAVKEGEAITIIGTNGSGKSTLLYALDGLLEPESGKITFYGLPKERAFPGLRQRISLLFQNPQVQLFSLTVWDDLCFGPLQMGLSQSEIERRVEDIMNLLNIGHLRDSSPWNLSGGEMKKVALGTCLSINPDVLLLDEPTSGLDPRSQVELIDVITALIGQGKTIITATHDLGIIQDISERTIVLGEDHSIIAEGKPWDIIRDSETLLRANLVHKHIHRHNWYLHEHSHAGIHDHEHIPEISLEGINFTISEEEFRRLLILIEHWKEHNIEHAATYIEWAEKIGEKNISEMLRQIATATTDINLIFEKLQRIIKH